MVKHTQTIRLSVFDILWDWRLESWASKFYMDHLVIRTLKFHTIRNDKKKYETGFWMNFHLNSIVVDTWNE